MKRILVFLVILSTILSACTKEGVYNPERKIKRIYASSQFLEEDKQLIEEYVWDNNLLVSKIFYADALHWPSTLTPEYKNGRLIKVNLNNGDCAIYKYCGNYLTKILWCPKSTDNESLEITLHVEHQNGKISKIYTDNNSNLKASKELEKLSNWFVPSALRQKTITERLGASNNQKSDIELLIWYLVWKGDNVVEIKQEIYTNSILTSTSLCSYEYDNKLNPKCICWPDFSTNALWSSQLVGYDMNFSKNNFTNVSFSMSSFNNCEQAHFTYEYDGDYPVKRTLKDGYLGHEVLYYEYE